MYHKVDAHLANETDDLRFNTLNFATQFDEEHQPVVSCEAEE